VKRNKTFITLMLLALLLAPLAGLRAQDAGADLELLEPSLVQSTPTATASTAWPVCQTGHWVRSSPGYPAVCTKEHVDDMFGPLGPCSIIVVNKINYHIVKIVKTDRGWLITVEHV
jgi:hypothetical protein